MMRSYRSSVGGVAGTSLKGAVIRADHPTADEGKSKEGEAAAEDFAQELEESVAPGAAGKSLTR